MLFLAVNPILSNLAILQVCPFQCLWRRCGNASSTYSMYILYTGFVSVWLETLQVLDSECRQEHTLVMGLGCSIPWLCLPLSRCLCPRPVSALISCSHLISHALISFLVSSSCCSCPCLSSRTRCSLCRVHCIIVVMGATCSRGLCILYHPSIDNVKCNIKFRTVSVPHAISYFVWPTSMNIFIEHSANLERWSRCLTHHIFKRYLTTQT